FEHLRAVRHIELRRQVLEEAALRRRELVVGPEEGRSETEHVLTVFDGELHARAISRSHADTPLTRPLTNSASRLAWARSGPAPGPASPHLHWFARRPPLSSFARALVNASTNASSTGRYS